MIDVIKAFFMLSGACFTLLAAVGIVRLPDLLTRMHASTKCATLGVMLTMIAVAMHFPQEVVIARAIAITLFVLMTAPVAAHLLGRAGYFVGVQLWDKTLKDELRPNYNPLSHRLHGMRKTDRHAASQADGSSHNTDGSSHNADGSSQADGASHGADGSPQADGPSRREPYAGSGSRQPH